MYSKEEKIKVYVMIGTIIMLLVIFSGITYAFFSATNNQGSTSLIEATSGKMLISYADGKSSLLVSKDIQPSNNIIVNKTFTLTGTNTTSGLTMPYKVGLKYTSTFSDNQMHYYIKEINRPASSKATVEYTGETNQTVQGNSTYTGYSHGTLKKGTKYTEMATGEFKANTSNQTITFNLILQFPDTGENQDSEKGKEINGKVEINHEASFAEASWDTIAKNVKAGKSNLYNVGDEKEVEIDGTSYTVRLANNTKPDECNGTDFSQTACGFVVEFVDIVERRAMNSTGTNVGGWPVTTMRTYANRDFFNKLPEDLRNVIIDTKVISGHGSTAGETNFTSTDKIYLLSAHEVYENGTSNNVLTSDTAYNNTRQLDYYKSKGVTTNNYSGAIKLYNSENYYWWVRVASSYDSSNFLIIINKGSWSNDVAYRTSGFAPAFRIG